MIEANLYEIHYRQALGGDVQAAKKALAFAEEHGREQDALLLVYVINGPAGGNGSNEKIDAEQERLLKENVFGSSEEVRRIFSRLSGELYIIDWNDPSGNRVFDIFSRAPDDVKTWYKANYGEDYFDTMLEIPSYDTENGEEIAPVVKKKNGGGGGLALAAILGLGAIGLAVYAFRDKETAGAAA